MAETADPVVMENVKDVVDTVVETVNETLNATTKTVSGLFLLNSLLSSETLFYVTVKRQMRHKNARLYLYL